MCDGLLMEFERGDLDHIFSLTCLSLKRDVEALGAYIAEQLRKTSNDAKVSIWLDPPRLMTLLYVLYSYSDRNELVETVQNML